MEIHSREKHWKEEWRKAKIFEAVPGKGKKFFCTFPYPYVNGLPHVGHLFSLMRTEAFARYKRLQGYNVLYPQGWHATGSPIATAAMRVKEKDKKQLQILKDFGVKESEFSKFAKPEYWIEYFAPRYKKDLQDVGLSIDWRREFHTTSLNPQYDAFIRWQFLTLQEKGYVQKGKHPVVWCSKEKTPVGDHDRQAGEGEVPQEFTLLKFPLVDEKGFIVAATLRPETVFGQTNMWISSEIEYVKADVGGEIWIISEECLKKLEEQGKNAKSVGKVKGRDLIGKYCIAPGIEKKIIILPSDFCDPNIGTGIVTSVPSHAPFDWIGLQDIQKDKEMCEKFSLDYDVVRKITPIALIDLEGWGEHPAQDICEKWEIKNQKQNNLLEKAKKLIYKEEHFKGVMMKLTGKYSGMKVEEAKQKVKEDLLKEKKADTLYELTGKVICRCQTEAVVKIVTDQWFIKYSNPEWKNQVHKALKSMNLYPEKSRNQFEYVVDWLNDWACTREFGLGTRLPWDEHWLIESLSDSTIYMAYYTVAHLIKEIPAERLTKEFFDCLFLGKGKISEAELLRKEFLYWYPMDFRNSGKDLIQNHLTFMLFNHTAIFPEKHWPRGIGVNGWVTVNGQKMSKQLGNVIPVRKLVKEYGADATRITILNGGEGMDDPNWDSDFARGMAGKLEMLVRYAENMDNFSNDETPVDPWLRSKMNHIIKQVTSAMEETSFRSAIQLAFFEYSKILRWYLARTMDKPNGKLFREAFTAQIIMLVPFIPHVCEEAWKLLGNKGFVSKAEWPSYDGSQIYEELDKSEEMVKYVSDSIRNASGKKISLFLADDWKRDAYKEFDKAAGKTRHPGEIREALAKTGLSKYGDELSRLIKFLVKNRTPGYVPTSKEERVWLESSKEYLSNISNAEVEILSSGDSDEKKAHNGLPGRPAIVIS